MAALCVELNVTDEANGPTGGFFNAEGAIPW